MQGDCAWVTISLLALGSEWDLLTQASTKEDGALAYSMSVQRSPKIDILIRRLGSVCASVAGSVTRWLSSRMSMQSRVSPSVHGNTTSTWLSTEGLRWLMECLCLFRGSDDGFLPCDLSGLRVAPGSWARTHGPAKSSPPPERIRL